MGIYRQLNLDRNSIESRYKLFRAVFNRLDSTLTPLIEPKFVVLQTLGQVGGLWPTFTTEKKS